MMDINNINSINPIKSLDVEWGNLTEETKKILCETKESTINTLLNVYCIQSEGQGTIRGNISNIQEIKYMCLSPQMKYRPDINYNEGQALHSAVASSNIKVVDFLLNDIRLQVNAKITKSNVLFRLACENHTNSLEMFKLLFNAPDIKRNPEKVLANMPIYLNIALSNNNLDTIKYIVTELNFTVSEKMKESLNSKLTDLIDYYIKEKGIKVLADKLNNDLSSRENDNKNTKFKM